MKLIRRNQKTASRDTFAAYCQLTDEASRAAFRGRFLEVIISDAKKLIPGYDDSDGERRILEQDIFDAMGESEAVGPDDDGYPPWNAFWQRIVDRYDALTVGPPNAEDAAAVTGETMENGEVSDAPRLDAPSRAAVPIDQYPLELDIEEIALRRSIEAYRTTMDEDEREAFQIETLGALSPTPAETAKDYGRDVAEHKVFEKIIRDAAIEALDTWPTCDPTPWADFARQMALTRIRPTTQPGGRAVPRSGGHATTPDPTAAFPGEDRSFGSNQLFVDLIPARCWFTSAAKCLVASDWDRIRHQVYERAGSVCEICGATGKGGALEAHERWEYDETAGVQRLRRLIGLCWACHEATHFGLAQVRGEASKNRAFTHLCRVNGWSAVEGDAHLVAAFAVWDERSERDWDLDLSILEAVGARFERSVVTDERAETARSGVLQDGGDLGQVRGLQRARSEGTARFDAIADRYVATGGRLTGDERVEFGLTREAPPDRRIERSDDPTADRADGESAARRRRDAARRSVRRNDAG